MYSFISALTHYLGAGVGGLPGSRKGSKADERLQALRHRVHRLLEVSLRQVYAKHCTPQERWSLSSGVLRRLR